MWIISAYQKHGDALLQEHSLGDIDVSTLRRLWDRPDEDPMYDSYPVTAEIADAIAEYVDAPLQLSAYDYFLEYMGETG
jgi:IS1 family transposase